MSDEIMSYEQWLEGVWTDDFWWDYLLDEFVRDCESVGIEIHQNIRGKYNEISFDIYHRQCTSSGRIVDNELFYKKYGNRLLAVSPILAQMFLEDWYYVRWKQSHRDWLEVSVELQNEYLHDESFKGGLMAGTSVGELYELALEHGNEQGFEQCFEEIIKDIHADLLTKLTEAYEYDTSEERYEEWKKEQLAEMNPPPTNAPPSLSC